MTTNNHSPIIYIAGPMTGLPEYNYPAFHRAAETLTALGYEVLSPATHTADVDTDEIKPWDFYMRHALGLLIRADAVALLPGWENSTGARIEKQLALDLGMRIAPVDGWVAVARLS